MKYIFIRALILSLLLVSCGFQVANYENNYNIISIDTLGDNKINFILKNKILNSSKKDNQNLLEISINTKKLKSIKEKNINNQITKYEIQIIAEIKSKLINKDRGYNFTVIKRGDYNVSKKYSDTLNNEKNLIKVLIIDLSEEIIENLAININDL